MTAVVDEEWLDVVFMALSDRTRRDILARLTVADATVKELAEPYAMSLQAVSQHIAVLERSGLVRRGRERQTRPCSLEPEALVAAASWIETSRQLWADRMDRLDAHLAQLQRETP